MNAALLSSVKMDWQTPDKLLDVVRNVAPIGLDPCTVIENPTGALYVCAHDCGMDGLTYDWITLCSADQIIYVNPPYGRALASWVTKCRAEAREGANVILLCPARTDTRWFPWDASRICFLKGRLTFKGAPAPAPFPSAVALWTYSFDIRDRFVSEFSAFGTVVIPR